MEIKSLLAMENRVTQGNFTVSLAKFPLPLSALVSINLFLTVSSSLQNSIFYSNLAFLASLTWITVAVAPPWLIGMSLIGVTSTFPLFPFPLSIGLGF